MDWFEHLTGFPERDYADTRRQLEIDGHRLRSRVNGRAWMIGTLELPSLANLRERVRAGQGPAGRLQVRTLSGDARALHRAPEFAGALFQVASQFNMLEMVGRGWRRPLRARPDPGPGLRHRGRRRHDLSQLLRPGR
ncbi:MAG: hypothetical protein U1E23_01655 [Reyranellaceae bacterium]